MFWVESEFVNFDIPLKYAIFGEKIPHILDRTSRIQSKASQTFRTKTSTQI